MNLLLDTHILIWALTEDPRLSERARQLILDAANVVYYSTASIWEISVKHSLHPKDIGFSGRDLSKYCREAGYFHTKVLLRHVQMRSGFFVLAKQSGGRRCSASLTEARQRGNGKDARSCAWIRCTLVSA